MQNLHSLHQDRVSRSILRGLNHKPITVEESIKRDQDAIIFGFPGWGKTTFLHHVVSLDHQEQTTFCLY